MEQNASTEHGMKENSEDFVLPGNWAKVRFYGKIQNCMKLIQIIAYKNFFELHNR